MKINGAIFDMDGTLIDSLMFWDVLWRKLGVYYRNDPTFRPDAVTEKAVRTLSLLEAMELLHKACNIGESGEALWRMATEMCVDFYAHEVQIKDGVLDFLEHLKQKNVHLSFRELKNQNSSKLRTKKAKPKLMSSTTKTHLLPLQKTVVFCFIL